MARFGEIGKQYFDDSGKVLANGQLCFFESGTATKKTTYADVNLTIPNTNPVILTAAGRQPNVFFNGTARVILNKSDGTQIEVRDPEGSSALDSAFSPWDNATIYNSPDIVIGSDGQFYLSITNGNQGNNPSSTPTEWTQIRFVRVWNVNETYSINQIVESSNGLLYSSIGSGNTGNDPITDNGVNWKPAAAASVESVISASAAKFAYDNF